jgi:hypothetical protein
MRYVNDINPVPKRGHRPVCDIRGRIYNNFAGGIIVQVKEIGLPFHSTLVQPRF